MKKTLFLPLFAAFVLLGCGSETKDEAKETAQATVPKETPQVKESAAPEAKEDHVENIKNEVKEIVEDVQTQTKEVIKKVQKEAEPVVSGVVTKTKEITTDIQQKIHKATAPEIDGKALFAPCVSCHGAQGQNKALNTSEVIQGWSKEKVLTALKGYKEGTYGKHMKAILNGQVKNLSDEQLEALASYISTL
jgi:cytochrome c553